MFVNWSPGWVSSSPPPVSMAPSPRRCRHHLWHISLCHPYSMSKSVPSCFRDPFLSVSTHILGVVIHSWRVVLVYCCWWRWIWILMCVISFCSCSLQPTAAQYGGFIPPFLHHWEPSQVVFISRPPGLQLSFCSHPAPVWCWLKGDSENIPLCIDD